MIGAALLELSLQDEDAAAYAQEALGSLTGGQGVETITQDRLQRFLWYELPYKWGLPADEAQEVAASLGRVLDLLDLPRYAAICRSAVTANLLERYGEGERQGLAAFRQAEAASGIHPPDLPELQWGEFMGVYEASAFTATAELLELAVASGELVPGGRGWKGRQQQLVRAHLATPRDDLMGQTLLGAVLTERVEWWLGGGRSQTRERILAPLANRLLRPLAPPPSVTDPCPPLLRWLLERLDDGVPLTQTGNLGRSFVQGAAARFGWPLRKPPMKEADLYDLSLLRSFAQRRLGLARKEGHRLVLTSKGRKLLGDAEGLWRTVAAHLLGDDPFTAFGGEIVLALLANSDSQTSENLKDAVGFAAAEEGFRDSRTGNPAGERAVAWAVHDVVNLCRSLGLLSVGGDWADRRYGLTELGKATDFEALRARAVRPRSVIWG